LKRRRKVRLYVRTEQVSGSKNWRIEWGLIVNLFLKRGRDKNKLRGGKKVFLFTKKKKKEKGKSYESDGED